ncbi:MAG: Ig domain-containing protein [Beijerinckiaceae bacterium]
MGDAAAAPGITYAKNPVTYTLGQTITSNTASCAGTLSKVSITPTLPDGLTVNPTTGTISGLPTQIVGSTAYSVSAQCSTVPVTATLTLGIGDALNAYYVDDINGNDSADGHTPATAWKSVNKVNTATLGPNTSVRFKRGGIWRERLEMQSGSSAGAIYYDAYGTGPKPKLMGSVNASNTSDWTALGGNLWQSVKTFPPKPGYTNGLPYDNANDVGNFLWGGHGNPGIGREKWSQGALRSNADWFFRTSDWRVVVYATANPATLFPGTELAINRTIVQFNKNGQNYTYLQNFAILFGAGNGISGNGNTSGHLTFRDLDVSYIGGGNLGGKGVRYGVGIEFWGSVHDIIVERCRVSQTFDAGISNQTTGANRIVHHVTYRNNVLLNVPASFEIWMRPSDTASTLHDIYVLNNSSSNPTSWRATQNEAEGPGGFALMLGSPAAVAAWNIVIENNALVDFPSSAMVLNQSFDTWKGVMTLDYNDWFHTGTMWVSRRLPTILDQAFTEWAAAFPAEQHGIKQDPLYRDRAKGDLHPGTGSPLFGKGVNLTSKGVVLDFDRKPRPATGAFTIGAFQ